MSVDFNVAHQAEVGEAWWRVRQNRLRTILETIRAKERLTIIQPFAPVDHDFPGMDVLHISDQYLWDDPTRTVDIYFSQGYAHNIPALWDVIKSGRAGVSCCWFWDNHHLIASTMRAAMLADVSFAAHSFSSDYIGNELGRYGGLVPLCPVYWGNTVSRYRLAEAVGQPRSNALYGGYNSYPGLDERNIFLEACKTAIPDNVLKVWPMGTTYEEHPFYKLSEDDRFREWTRYKTALCVSFGVNTTIRMFDSLLTGQIPIVVGEIHDLDAIIPLHEQEQLPVLRVKTLDPMAVKAAYQAALIRFDAEGEVGVSRRSQYILDNHMPRNRIMQMVDAIRNMDI